MAWFRCLRKPGRCRGAIDCAEKKNRSRMDGCKGKREVESMSDAVTDKPTVPGQDPPPPAGTRAVEVGGGG